MVQSMKKSIEFVSLAKTLIWSVPLLAILVPLAIYAAPGNTGTGTTGPIVGGGTNPFEFTCNMRIDNLIAGMKKPDNQPTVAVHSTIIVGEKAYAEGALPATGGGFQGMPGGQAKPSGEKISGHGNLGALPVNAVFPLAFEIEKSSSGRGKLKWTFQGQSYQADVDSCESHYWTATTTKSTIAIKLGAVSAIITPH